MAINIPAKREFPLYSLNLDKILQILKIDAYLPKICYFGLRPIFLLIILDPILFIY